MAMTGSSHGRVPGAPEDPVELLRFDVSYPNWAEEVANRHKAFFIRGFTTFSRDYLRNQSIVSSNKAQWFVFIDRMKELCQDRPLWANSDFDLLGEFAINQLQAGLSRTRRPLLFGKAVQTIGVLEAIAEAIHKADSTKPAPGDMYQYIGIEAAVSHIVSLERSSFQTVLERDENLAQRLLDVTGQKSLTVFFDLADRKHSVTHKLAVRARDFISENMKSLHVGEAAFEFDPLYRISPSPNEFVQTEPNLHQADPAS